MKQIDRSGYFLTVRALGAHHHLEIDQARFEEIQTAWSNLCHVVDLEESWDAIVQNYLDLEKGLLEAAARHMIFRTLDYHYFQEIRLAFAVKLANLLSTCRAYLDQTPRHLKSLKPKCGEEEEEAFKQAARCEYDRRLGYRFMEALRNYSQHRGLPLHGASFDSRRKEGEEGGRVQFSVATYVMMETLRRDGYFKQSVLKEVAESKLQAEPLIREYIEGLNCIHMGLRKRLKEQVEDWSRIIRDAIAEFVEGSPDCSTLGLYAVQSGKKNEWLQEVPLFEGMLERLKNLQNRNGSLHALTDRFVSSAPRYAKK